jgi:serine/threonine protein kinase/tetratricopeptide (TPR) repeat protein
MSSHHRENQSAQVASISADSLDLQDDPRVASILAAYLAELEAGGHPSRDDLLERHPDLARALADCLDVVEFVHSAARTGSLIGPVQPPEDALPPDTMLGEYRLVREIGRGATGIVYEAEQISLERRVALKVLSGSAALDPMKLQRFQVETQALAQLHHPHIVPIFAVGSERGTYHYSMQYIDGTTLADVIHQVRRSGQGPGRELQGRPSSSVTGQPPRGRASSPLGHSSNGTSHGALSLSRSGLTSSSPSSSGAGGAFRPLARLAIQAAEALDHAHAMGILHRDIKPSNLLVDATGNLWVTDFGLARFQDEPGMTRTGDLLGTLRYMAPELLRGHRTVYDPRCDIYALGATLYELLTLRPVFDGRDRQVLLRQIAQEEPIPPRRLDATVPRDLETIVQKAMDKEPDRRYATARELALDLRRFIEGKTIRARRPSPAERAAKWARRHRAVIISAATVAFLALAVATPFFWWEQRNTARMYEDLRLTFGQADRGFDQMVRLSDALAINGMARYSEPGASPEAVATRAGFFQQAVEFYDRLTREPRIAKPMMALAYRRLGLARMVGTKDPRARADLERSLALYEELLAAAPSDPELRFAISDVAMNLGLILVASRGIAAAEPSVHRATSIEEGLAADFPDDSGYLLQLTSRRLQIAGWMETSGLPVLAKQERDQLFAFYDRLAGAATGLPRRARIMADSYERLASALGDEGRYREQQEALRRGLELEPESAALLNDLAWSLSLRPDAPPRKSAEAIELAKRAIAINPKERAFWNTLGLAYLRAGNLPLAAEAVQKSMELQSQGGDASDRLFMAMISWRRGDKARALDWYIQALEWLSIHPIADPTLSAFRTEAEHLLGRSPGNDARPKS